jgi:hypothetical protein
VNYRLVALTHSSSARENDPPTYVGSSSATWSLAPPTKSAPNTLSVTTGPPVTVGLGRVNIRGVFRAQARTNRTRGNCSLTAATGSKKYPLVAPGPFSLAVTDDPKSPKRLLFAQGLGLNVHASLSNAYFPSECSTSISGEPDTDTLMLKSVPKSTFTQKTVVIRFSGSTNKEGIAYRWSTVFTFRRIG